MYTLQSHPQTRKRQIELWTQILLNHVMENQIYKTSINELIRSPICKHPDDDNNRQLFKEDLKVILEQMADQKQISMHRTPTGYQFDSIFFDTPERMNSVASNLLAWVDEDKYERETMLLIDVAEEFKQVHEVPVEFIK